MLSRVQCEKCLSYEKGGIEFFSFGDKSKVALILGTNGSGKTNWIRICDFLLEASNHRTKRFGMCEAEFTLDFDDQEAISQFFPEGANLSTVTLRKNGGNFQVTCASLEIAKEFLDVQQYLRGKVARGRLHHTFPLAIPFINQASPRGVVQPHDSFLETQIALIEKCFIPLKKVLYDLTSWWLFCKPIPRPKGVACHKTWKELHASETQPPLEITFSRDSRGSDPKQLNEVESAVVDLLWNLVALFDDGKKTIIFDEPDRTFHPTLARQFLYLMREQLTARPKSVLLLSHSRDAVHFITSENIWHCLSLKDSHGTFYSRVKSLREI